MNPPHGASGLGNPWSPHPPPGLQPELPQGVSGARAVPAPVQTPGPREGAPPARAPRGPMPAATHTECACAHTRTPAESHAHTRSLTLTHAHTYTRAHTPSPPPPCRRPDSPSLEAPAEMEAQPPGLPGASELGHGLAHAWA